VVELTLDKATNQIATPACPDDYKTAFIEGTQPTQTCEQTASDGHGNFFQRVFGLEPKQPPPVSNTNGPPAQSTGQPPKPANQDSVRTSDDDKGKKKGFWGRIFGSSKDDKKDDNKENKPATNGPGDRPPQ